MSIEQKQLKAVKRAVYIAGGPARVARHFNITTWAVCKWTRCPKDRCLELEKLCYNQVSRYKLRPDIYGRSNKAAINV